MNGEDTDAHKLQYFPTSLQGKSANWFTCYKIANHTITWGKVQRAFISKFNDVCSERQAVIALKEMKQWKHEIMEDYYDRFLQLCVIILQQSNDVYLRKTFREGLKKKLKLTIIRMPMAFQVQTS